MTPEEYEEAVAEHFRRRGYDVERTPASNDWGIDCFAKKGTERLAIQAKKYGGTSRKVNRQMVMELHGAKDYFECTRAVLATDGELMESAKAVAQKLQIEILRSVVASEPERTTADAGSSEPSGSHPSSLSEANSTFDAIWEHHIMPMKGQVLRGRGDRTNTVVDVDWGSLTRISSNGNKQKIPIEVFRRTVEHLLEHGFVSRDDINQHYAKRASSGVVLILSQVPDFEATTRPTGLRVAPQTDP